jgi:hypothetical protein
MKNGIGTGAARQPFMLGVAARLGELTGQDLEWMQEAGIGWLRFGDFRFDPRAFREGREQGAEFQEAKQRARDLRAAGFQIMGLTPGPRELKDWIGVPGSREYLDNYRRINAFYAEEFSGLVEWWQMANELDIWIFREKLSMAQSVDFLKAGIRGLKETAPEMKVGINITLFPSLPGEVDGNTDLHEGLVLARGIYGDSGLPVDYAGFDSYPGTWRQGGPESWHEYLDGFHRLTGKPIIIQEFGYASAGGLMNEDEIARGLYPCQAKKWKFSWRGGHSEEAQAAFIRESFRIFAEKPHVIGATYYNWRDARQCWQCKQPDCPAETAWGLLDREGRRKKAFEGLKAAAAEFLNLNELTEA